jgi:hypothetical protein
MAGQRWITMQPSADGRDERETYQTAVMSSVKLGDFVNCYMSQIVVSGYGHMVRELHLRSE